MTTSRSRAQAHAKHAHHCSCGKTVHGNGGKASHEYMHERRNDGQGWLTYSEYRRRQLEACGRETSHAERFPNGSCRGCGFKEGVNP